jgi:hypothetical protein
MIIILFLDTPWGYSVPVEKLSNSYVFEKE